MKDVLYISADFTVFPTMMIHHAPREPKPSRLTRVLTLCERELDGDPFIENGEWVCALKEPNNGQGGDSSD